MRIGVLAIQGDFAEHIAVLKRIGAETREVRLPAQLEELDGLILPGGESTTIGKLMGDFGLLEPLREFGRAHAVWGTCAGAILLSKDARRSQPLLGLMDITVQRNAFGRQVDSFEANISIKGVDGDKPFHAIFIRAPLIESVGANVEVLARVEKDDEEVIVAAQQGNLLVTSFHPELSNDDRFHRYFVNMADRQT